MISPAKHDRALSAINVVLVQAIPRFTNLCATCDNVANGHVSITPKDMGQMQSWIDSRGSAEIHPLTQELTDAVVGTVRK
jgi:hypothetical protein